MADVAVPEVVQAEEAPQDVQSAGETAGDTEASETEKGPVKKGANGAKEKENVAPKRLGSATGSVRRPATGSTSTTKPPVGVSSNLHQKFHSVVDRALRWSLRIGC